jgi:pentatricopeptide repeat protein
MIVSLLQFVFLVALTGNSVSALSMTSTPSSSNPSKSSSNPPKKKGSKPKKSRMTAHTRTTGKLLVPDPPVVSFGKGKSKNQAQNVLSQQRRQESLDAGHHPLLSLNLNLDALARAQAAERAQELYHRIAALHVEGYYAVAPDVVSFNSVLKAWQSDPVQALEFWKTASGAGSELQLNVRSYNTLILSLAKAGLFDQALLVLRQMQETAADASSYGAMIILPDRITYNTVLLAAAVSRETAAAKAAEELLREMIKSEYLQPDTISYNTVIDAWSNLAKPDRAEYWLQQLVAPSSSSSTSSASLRKTGKKVRPDVYSFTTVIQAWAVTGGPKACLRAWEILQDMLREDKNADVDADQQPGDTLPLRPNQILQDMLREDNDDDYDKRQRGNVRQLRPNKVTYTVVMHALCRNGELTKAQSLLEDMLDQADRRPETRPDVVTFSVLLDGWAAVAGEHPEEALRAVGTLLRRMNELAVDWPDTAPTAQTYTSVLSALAHSRQYQAPDQALGVLQTMSTDAGVEPTVIHYNAALDCCAKSPRADKVDVAVNIWKTMREAGVECDGITWNSLLAVSAGAFGTPANRRRSLQLALHVWSILQQREKEDGDEGDEGDDGIHDRNYIRDPPTSLTFYYFFKTIRKFMESSPARWKLTVNAFESCCQHGCLNEIVLELVVQHLIPSPEQGRALLKEYWLDDTSTNDKAVLIEDLPKEWTFRAMRNRRRREPKAQ